MVETYSRCYTLQINAELFSRKSEGMGSPIDPKPRCEYNFYNKFKGKS